MKRALQFFKDSYAELKKVVWPTREEVIESTKVVVVSVVIIALFLGLFDIVFQNAMLLIF